MTIVPMGYLSSNSSQILAEFEFEGKLTWKGF